MRKPRLLHLQGRIHRLDPRRRRTAVSRGRNQAVVLDQLRHPRVPASARTAGGRDRPAHRRPCRQHPRRRQRSARYQDTQAKQEGSQDMNKKSGTPRPGGHHDHYAPNIAGHPCLFLLLQQAETIDGPPQATPVLVPLMLWQRLGAWLYEHRGRKHA